MHRAITRTTSLARRCLALLVLPVLCAAPARAQDAACQPRALKTNENLVLSASGTYCLASDLVIESGWDLPDAHSRNPDETLAILADQVTLDLQGHAIDGGNRASGISLRRKGEGRHASMQSAPGPRQVAIRNGSLHAQVSAAISAGFTPLSVPSDLGPSPTQLSTEWLERELRRRPSSPASYEQRGIHIEHMHIDARERKFTADVRAGAINIQGAGTVIRDCVIETDAGTAIWLFGPGAVIEDNTIIVHGAAPLREADAPIRLHQGDGAVIRNNKFVIKGEAHRRGISLFDTGPVTLENNRFYGMTEQDGVAKAFTGTLQVRESGSRFAPAWQALFGDH